MENGQPEPTRSPVPTSWILASAALVLVLVSGLIWFLFQRTEGPAPVLRRFAERLHDGDCEGAYRLLHPDSQEKAPQEEPWCEDLRPLIEPDFEVHEMELSGDVVHIVTNSPTGCVWELRKLDDEWRVVDCSII